jgi:protein-S-isoprenylcysteine O-methyltransferase Ste14
MEGGYGMKLKALVGSGDRIGLFVLPFVVLGLVLTLRDPSLLSIPQSTALDLVGAVFLVLGLIVWAWSVTLILIQVPRGRLITSGPYTLVKHPLYTGVSLLLLPGLGFLVGTWLGLVFGIVLYAGSRIFAPEEEKALSRTFGAAWDDYTRSVLVPWL